MDNAHLLRIQHETLHHKKLTHHKSFASYVWDSFTHTPFYLHWQHLLSLIRRFRTLAFVLRVLTLLLAILQTGALVVLTAALFLVILPVVILLTLGILITAFFRARQANETLGLAIGNRLVRVLFMTHYENPFLLENAKNLAAGGACVIVVSPYWIGKRGLTKGKLYTTFREEFPRVYLIRKYYFFNLRKNVLDPSKTAYLY